MSEWIHSGWPLSLSTLCLLISVVVTFTHAHFHLLHFHKPYLQSHVLRIIMVAPIYGVGAFFSFAIPSSQFVMSCMCDIWEAVVVYSFLLLIMEYMGGEHHCMAEISGKEDGNVPQIWPLNHCFGPVQQSHMIRLPKRLALQFVFLKPVMALLNIIVYYLNSRSYPTSYSIFTNVVYNTSYSLALAGLFLLYSATHDLPNLQDKRLMSKFISVKGVVFLTYWQALLFHIFLHGDTKKWENFILSLETGVFTLMLTFAFWFKEFREPEMSECTPGKANVVSLDIFELPMEDDSESPRRSSYSPKKCVANTRAASNNQDPGDKKMWLKNARTAFNPADVLVDAKQSFSRRYARHVILEDERSDAVSPRKIPDTVDIENVTSDT